MHFPSTTLFRSWSDIVSSADPLPIGPLSVTAQYRAVVQSGSCPTENSAAATVQVDPTTVAGSASATLSAICNGSSTTITLSGQTGAIVKWQSSPDGSTWSDIVSSDKQRTTGKLSVTTQ